MTLPVALIAFSAAVLSAALSDTERIYVVSESALTWISADTGVGHYGMGGGIDFDVAISPDRQTLYQLSGDALVRRSAETLDTLGAPGVPEIVPLPHRQHWIFPEKSAMALSRSGSWLYLSKQYTSPAQEDFAVATFDTAMRQLLPLEAHIGECQGAAPIPLPADRQLLVVCGGDSTVHFLTIAEDGSAANDFTLAIPPLPVKTIPGPRVGRNDRQEYFVQSALTPDGSACSLQNGMAVRPE